MHEPHRVRRVVTGLGSAALLLILLAGIPYALFRLGGGVLPDHVPSLSAIRADLFERDETGAVFACALVLIGWFAWASFALPVLVEAAARLAGGRSARLPGLRIQQRTAAALIGGVLLMFASPLAASAATAPTVAGPPTAGVRPAAVVAASRTGSTSPSVVGQRPIAQQTVYEVRHGDYLGSIAARFEGDFDAYSQLAEANHITNADRILPGWRIVLPSGAVDHGTRDHATGHVTTPAAEAPATSSTVSPPTTAPAPTTPPSATTPPAKATSRAAAEGAQPVGGGSRPTTTFESPAPVLRADRQDDANAPHVTVTEVVAAGGTLATALVVAAAIAARREQAGPRTPRRRSAVPGASSSLRRMADRLMDPVHEDDVLRLDASLRSLAAAVDGRPIERMPQIPAVWLDDGTITLILADDCWPAPEPYERSVDGWTLAADTVFPAYPQRIAPLPTLVTAGGRGAAHLLLDLEYLRYVGITGDPSGAGDLLRYLAAELVHNIWSDDVRVLLSGFGGEAAALVSLAPDRIRLQPSVPDAVERFRQRLARAVADRDAPVGPPELLFVADPPPAAYAALAALERELMDAPGVGLAVVTAPVPSAVAGRYTLHVDPAGLLQAGFLGDALMPAGALPRILVPDVAALVGEARRRGTTSPIDIARAASRAALRAASGEKARVVPRATMAGQHRRKPGAPPRVREAAIDLMRPRHAARG